MSIKNGDKKWNYNLRYVFTDFRLSGIVFRARIFITERLIPKDLNFYGREKIIGYIDGMTISETHCSHKK